MRYYSTFFESFDKPILKESLQKKLPFYSTEHK